MKRLLIFLLAFILFVLSAAYVFRKQIEQKFFGPGETPAYQGIHLNEMQKQMPGEEDGEIEIIAENLSIPWEIIFLPEGDLLVTERSGTLKRISNGKTYPVSGVVHKGEGGLLGAVLHPNFAHNHWIYLYLTTQNEKTLINRVERYIYDQDKLSNPITILDNIPGANFHDGGRIAFGPDQKLYIATGDATKSNLAQDTHSLAGKILRINEDGSIPNDNPFNNAVWSYGHRNPQGLTWDEKGNLWSTEHGRSGLTSGLDELNLIEKGKNYGWPEIQGNESRGGMQTPMFQSGPDITWAPASAAYWNGRIFFGGLRGESLYEADVRTQTPTIQQHYFKDFGRIRTVAIDPSETYLYFTTSNTDGRGTIRKGDDKLIRINLSVLDKLN